MNLFFFCSRILLVGVLSSTSLFAEEKSDKADLTVDIANIASVDGTIRIALYQYVKGADWNDKPYRVAEISSAAVKGVTHYTFEALPFNDYAIRLFQDVNGNKILDLSETGLPLEPFAISRSPNEKQQSLLMKDAIISVNLHEQRLVLTLLSIKQN